VGIVEETVTTDSLGRRTGPRTQHTIEEKVRVVEETQAPQWRLWPAVITLMPTRYLVGGDFTAADCLRGELLTDSC
jgi:hypothetical protein